MSMVNLRHAMGATAQIHHHGAHVTSWKTADGIERLFLSERAEFKSGAAIRGGVPIIFPQFASLGPLPKHGFARTMQWQLDTGKTSADTATFFLTHSPETLAIWPFRFTAGYHVTLGADQLQMQLAIKNEDEKDFSFTTALHTYLRVTDIDVISLHGLHGCRYRDSANGNVERTEPDEAVRIKGEVDRIYFSTPLPIVVSEPGNTVQCTSRGFGDTVIWNPGAVLSQKLTDMNDDGYRHMLCVEAAAIASPIRLAPSELWQGTQVLVVK
ncbi:MAG: D-hexose-6-phosphate mutarotase [Steroidobacter sp.]